MELSSVQNQFEGLTEHDFELEAANFQTLRLSNGKAARVYHSTLSGAAQTAVFVHGFNFFCEMYAPFLKRLEKYFNVLAFDLPGHGKTDFYGNYELEQFYDFILEVAGHFDLGEHFMVGHSMGGLIALACSQSARFADFKKFIAFAPAGVKIIESANQRFARSKCGGCLGSTCTSIASAKAVQEMEIRSFSRMPVLVAECLRTLYNRIAASSKTTLSNHAKRTVKQVQNFPWNGLFATDLNSDRVKIVLAKDDAYIDFSASFKVFPTSDVTQTIHENCIVCPQFCVDLLCKFVQ